jgi:hypothetical protein
MKKVLIALLFVAGALAVQSCGGAEKCPAYTAAPAASQVTV